ncbi:hypothetical protein BMF94_3998 [Rhodotorula taiwanensis]|uniref:Uncharacterized protein n=1 Tax=Rhodotorula taiwanensis TaxID=741276 RepID=A0A2S5B8A7_9BASI|nr:hypothetical protein BMF94_3998 [Rhodotorula taiwanensis]
MNSAAADLEGAIEGLYGQGTLTWGAYKKLLALLHSCQVHHVAGEQDVHRWFQEILQGYGTATSEQKGALTRDVSAVLSGLSSGLTWPPKLPLKRSKTGAVEVWEALVLFCDTHNYSREPGVRAWAAAVCANAYLFEAANRWWRKSFTEGLNALYRTFRMLTPGRQCSTALSGHLTGLRDCERASLVQPRVMKPKRLLKQRPLRSPQQANLRGVTHTTPFAKLPLIRKRRPVRQSSVYIPVNRRLI